MSRARRALERSFAATLCVAAFTGCSGGRVLGDYPESTCDFGEPPSELAAGRAGPEPIAIATFWTEDTHENTAFGQLTRHLDREKYFVRIDEMPTRVATQRHIRDAFKKRGLPDLFQVNGGSDVLCWVESRRGDERDLCPLDSLRDAYGWQQAYFPEALSPLSCDGSLYALPVGVHHLNVLFYNRRLFHELGVLAGQAGISLTLPEELTSPHALVELLEQVSQLDATTPGGDAIVPLALGSSDDWPLTIVAFENVLLGLQRNAYETLWMGGLASDGDGSKTRALEASLREMLDVLRELVNHSNYDDGLDWQTAMQQVGAGKALFTITGDWGYAQLDGADAQDVATVTFPGTRGKFVYTPDSFAVPRDVGKNGFQPRAFLHDAAQARSALIEFANAKHAIPPRIDLDEGELAQLTSPGLRATYEEFSGCARGVDDCQLLLAVSGLGPSPGVDPCLDEVDAALALAVAGKPLRSGASGRTCDLDPPQDPAQAEEHLLKLWLEVAQRRFAASCREAPSP